MSGEDPLRIISCQLRDLGHVVEYSDKEFVLEDEGINLITEGFSLPVISELSAARADGARFLFLAMEEPTTGSFNHAFNDQMVWRFDNFPSAAKLCDGILYLVPGGHVHEWYNRWAPASHLELGYSEALVRSSGVEPEYDFGFFGSMTDRRFQILRRLNECSGLSVSIESSFPTTEKRDRVMSQVRVILQLRRFEESHVISSTRCNIALCLGRPVLAEPHGLSEYSHWSRIVKFSKSIETFFQDAVEMRDRWREIHATQFSEFRRILTPQLCVERALKEIRLDMSLRPGDGSVRLA